MKNLFSSYGLVLDGVREQKLEAFRALLEENNKKFNLTAVTSPEEIWIKHFLDSALGSPLFPSGANCCDVGAGGGFPSIPLMIMRPDLRFTLIEATGKKCAFLREAAAALDLNADVVNIRAEDAALASDKPHAADSANINFREKFDAVTARAVARLNTLAEYCLPLVRVGGVFVAYKGRDDGEVAEAANAISLLGGEVASVTPFALPGGAGERNIILIKKIKSTPAKYPRGNGKPRRNPL